MGHRWAAGTALVVMFASALASCGGAGPTIPPIAPSTPFPSAIVPVTPAPTAAPSATAEPAPTAPPFHLGATGDVVTVEVAPSSGDSWIAVAQAFSPTAGIEQAVARTFRLPDGWTRTPDLRAAILPTGSGAAYPDGRLALEVTTPGEDMIGVVVVNLADPTSDGVVLPVLEGSSPTWLPDGSLLTFGGGTTADRGHVMVYPAGATSPTVTLAEADGVSFNRQAQGFIVAADGSGVFAVQAGAGDTRSPVIVAWDGTVTPRDPALEPLFNFGTERPTAADGSTVTDGCDTTASGSHCASTWTRANGTRIQVVIPSDRMAQAHAWTPDGTQLVFLTRTDVGVAEDRGGNRIYTRLATSLPPAGVPPILALMDESIVVGDQTGQAWIVRYVDTGLVGPLPGVVAGVLR